MESRIGTLEDAETIKNIENDMKEIASWDRPRSDQELSAFVRTRFSVLSDDESEIE